MRCIFGLVLCVVLCYGGIQTLNAVATASAAANNPGLSQRAAQAAGWKVVEKYHAVVYAAAGLIALAVCSLPTLLAKHTGFNEAEEWRRMARSEANTPGPSYLSGGAELLPSGGRYTWYPGEKWDWGEL